MNICVKYSPVTLLPESKQGLFIVSKITKSENKPIVMNAYHYNVDGKEIIRYGSLINPVAA